MTHGAYSAGCIDSYVAKYRRFHYCLGATMSRIRILAFAVVLSAAQLASAVECVNRFVSRREGPRQIVTLLTGKLTFQEAQDLAKSIQARKAPPLEWVDDGGKTISKQLGELKIVRPMPVGCDGKSSGVVLIVTFPTAVTPAKKMNVKLNADTTVAFDQQAQ